MGNIVNHKCFLTKRNGMVTLQDLERLVSKIEGYSHVYSDYYVSMEQNQMKIEYVANGYPMFFEEEEINAIFDIVDIYSDGGGAPDKINLAKKSAEKVKYKFDEIKIKGKHVCSEEIEKRFLQKDGKTLSIQKNGFIEANTFNEVITEISNQKKVIIKMDEKHSNKLLLDSLEIWSLEMEDEKISNELITIINTLTRKQHSRNYKYLQSITFLFNKKEYFEISWNAVLKSWEDKRVFDLWGIVEK